MSRRRLWRAVAGRTKAQRRRRALAVAAVLIFVAGWIAGMLTGPQPAHAAGPSCRFSDQVLHVDGERIEWRCREGARPNPPPQPTHNYCWPWDPCTHVLLPKADEAWIDSGSKEFLSGLLSSAKPPAAAPQPAGGLSRPNGDGTYTTHTIFGDVVTK